MSNNQDEGQERICKRAEGSQKREGREANREDRREMRGGIEEIEAMEWTSI